jgi:hypothetical protein
MSDLSKIRVYHIAPRKLSIQELKTYKHVLRGVCEVLDDGKTLTIMRIDATGGGTGTSVMSSAILDAIDCDYISCDDMSDRYRKDHNIYRKFGMKYLNPTYGPEMTGSMTDARRVAYEKPLEYGCFGLGLYRTDI